MLAIIYLLRSDIARLSTELSELIDHRARFLVSIDRRISDVRTRLAAAESVLANYSGQGTGSGARTAGGLSPGPGNDQPLPALPTWEEVCSVDMPVTLQGHRLRPNSKKAKIIRATEALLLAQGAAARSEIVIFLMELGILGKEKNSGSYVSVILSHAREIFQTDGSVWSLRNNNNKPSSEPSPPA